MTLSRQISSVAFKQWIDTSSRLGLLKYFFETLRVSFFPVVLGSVRLRLLLWARRTLRKYK